MPHLSPMSWIIAISSFWFSLTILTSTLWWSNHHSFYSTSKYDSSSMENLWKWS
uniref:ATP synthase F0 subunit 8 n=1 Tax=Eisenia nana TaxID=2690238 RepID=A0A6B9ITL4_9ANNE|nr:ATP synthase F0 subunit 8 [Eisenia nana]